MNSKTLRRGSARVRLRRMALRPHHHHECAFRSRGAPSNLPSVLVSRWRRWGCAVLQSDVGVDDRTAAVPASVRDARVTCPQQPLTPRERNPSRHESAGRRRAADKIFFNPNSTRTKSDCTCAPTPGGSNIGRGTSGGLKVTRPRRCPSQQQPTARFESRVSERHQHRPWSPAFRRMLLKTHIQMHIRDSDVFVSRSPFFPLGSLKRCSRPPFSFLRFDNHKR